MPTKTNDEEPLQNILSISTAGRNRYLLHFNSHHSLLQWTAGIRLAMFEHGTLQEAYTGALIAGKGKQLNNIGVIMERSRFKVESWVRVRFGAGVPWRRCWCVIQPADEKEYQKMQKDMKKRSPYDRSHPPALKGDIKFYDSRKDADKKKKARPIASITDAFAAYAIYPQSRALIDNSTLLKIEGHISIHSETPSENEGFVFIMPETPPAVSGFEMLLRFLFPTWDTFGLYGRPGRLVASVLDARSLMFAMPKGRRYGYLETLDVTAIISADGSAGWSERDWRKKMKELTGTRMSVMEESAKSHSRSESRSSKRLSFGPQSTAPGKPRVNFADDSGSTRSSRSLSLSRPGPRTDSAPPDTNRQQAPPAMSGVARHVRNSSDPQFDAGPPGHAMDGPPGVAPPAVRGADRARNFASDLASTPERGSSEDDRSGLNTPNHLEGMRRMETPEPVSAPPSFSRGPGAKPQQKPYHSPEMRRANSRLSSTTLSQLANAGGLTAASFPDDPTERYAAEDRPPPGHPGALRQAVQPQAATPVGMNANSSGSREALNDNPLRSPQGFPPPHGLSEQPSRSLLSGPVGPPPSGFPPNFRPAPPPHNPQAGRPPMMNPGGPSPDGRPYTPPRDPRMGPPPGPGAYPARGPPPSGPPPQGGPPPGPRRTPPPNLQMQRQPPPHLQGGGSPPINRKPLPQRTTSLQRRPEDGHGSAPQSPVSSNGSFTQRMLDESAMAQVRPAEHLTQRQAPFTMQNIARQNTETSSRYDDNSSTTSPDYASTRRSTDTQESVERPRAGVLRTVGDSGFADGPPGAKGDSSDYAVPDINFGPTINYSRTKAPTPTAPRSPNPAFGPQGQAVPQTHARQESEDTIRRSIAWQPGMAVTTPGAERALTPEEYVHQRMAASAAPLYSHSRNASGNTLSGAGTGTPTPPLARPGSQQAYHSRNNSADLLAGGRPLTPGSAAALSGGEMSSYLSAREQEHVARVTGTPLISVAGNKGAAQPQSGLVGAIDARERERAQMKQGFASHSVAQAIDQRQRDQNQQAQRAAQAAYAQQQAQFAAQQQQQQGYRGAMVSPGPPPSAYGSNMGGMRSMSPGPGMMALNPGPGMMNAPRSHSPGPGMMNAPRSMSPGPGMMNPGPGMMNAPRSMSPGPGMMNTPRSHSPGPGMMSPSMMSPGMGPPRMNANFQPMGGQGPPQGRQQMMQPQMMPPQQQQPYGSAPPPGGQGYGQGGGWPNTSMRPPPGPGSPTGGGYQLPPQGQYSNPGTPAGPRPGTPGRMPFQGHAF